MDLRNETDTLSSDQYRNGTRLICKAFKCNVIDTEIAIASGNTMKNMFLPRTTLTVSEDDMSGVTLF